MLSRFICVLLLETPWTLACQAPLSVEISQARILEWVVMPSSRGSFGPKEGPESLLSALAGGFFTTSTTWEAHGFGQMSNDMYPPL